MPQQNTKQTEKYIRKLCYSNYKMTYSESPSIKIQSYVTPQERDLITRARGRMSESFFVSQAAVNAAKKILVKIANEQSVAIDQRGLQQ